MADETGHQDFVAMINATMPIGWTGAMGLRVTRATRDEVVAELDVTPTHHQPYGIVHGGVHASIIETLASVGAAISAMPEGKSVVGLENHTSFLKAVRSGVIRAVARPVSRGRTSHVWEVNVTDERGNLAATGRVRLLLLEGDVMVAGEKVGIKVP